VEGEGASIARGGVGVLKVWIRADHNNDCLLVRCDDLFPSQKVNTYVNLLLSQESRIDYILVSDASYVSQFAVLDPDINFSDHLPLFTKQSKAKQKKFRRRRRPMPLCPLFLVARAKLLLFTHLIDLVT